MSIIPVEQVWINANFKETQLSGVKIGQKVSIVTDFYGSDVVFNGRVDGINMGTGSAFSVLPAQNATGNWIKVVQRLPVRITLDAEQIKAYPLRIGLSATVRLHETHSQGEHWQRRSEKPRLTQATHWLSIPPLLITKSSISSKPTRCDL
ncbi:multidrug transporter [Klebsiella pneumoniae]|uniref:Multidrug transporter n=1 Tax=Klebsiella pneumoniae TaxID=573 RepID=A0A2X3D2U9_KLEPN|nr:multidrug transporter [Klebsiella pneumoniae]